MRLDVTSARCAAKAPPAAVQCQPAPIGCMDATLGRPVTHTGADLGAVRACRACPAPCPPDPKHAVLNPFNIEEIFPAQGGGSGRLPRRQSGSSPQGLAVTLMADYTLRTRAWLPSAAIVALLDEFGVGTAAAR